MKRCLVPDIFVVPEMLENNEFRLRMLTVNDLIKDYDAVITSVDHLAGAFPPGGCWPQGLTLEQDLIDLGWHQKEFQRRTSFAYTMMSLDESECLGCVYLYPSDRADYDAICLLWVRASQMATGLDDRLFKVVQVWLAEVWPFSNVAFPGRLISWADWLSP